jgi:hypothetical protein
MMVDPACFLAVKDKLRDRYGINVEAIGTKAIRSLVMKTAEEYFPKDVFADALQVFADLKFDPTNTRTFQRIAKLTESDLVQWGKVNFLQYSMDLLAAFKNFVAIGEQYGSELILRRADELRLRSRILQFQGSLVEPVSSHTGSFGPGAGAGAGVSDDSSPTAGLSPTMSVFASRPPVVTAQAPRPVFAKAPGPAVAKAPGPVLAKAPGPVLTKAPVPTPSPQAEGPGASSPVKGLAVLGQKKVTGASGLDERYKEFIEHMVPESANRSVQIRDTLLVRTGRRA